MLDADERCVTLADGSSRKLEKPKRKNKKHIQLIRIKNPIDSNEAIKHSIKDYRRNADV